MAKKTQWTEDDQDQLTILGNQMRGLLSNPGSFHASYEALHVPLQSRYFLLLEKYERSQAAQKEAPQQKEH